VNLDLDFARALDPMLLAEAVGLTLDEWQARVLRSPVQQQLLNCCRQSGKTTVTALRALHRALYQPGSLTLAISPSQRQSTELVRKGRDYLNVLQITDVDQESVLAITLANGSRILALPASDTTIRGYSPDLVLVDEAARVPDATIDAVRPMLAVTSGQLIELSTPWGMQGRFWEAWTMGGPEWERTEVDAYSCPRISPEWLEQERREMPRIVFESEYLCRFTDTLSQVFSTADILGALSDEIQPLFPFGGRAA
jgi:hypothetical protein